MYKIELHLHTKYASICGELSAKEIVNGYLRAGYSGLALTDHYNRDTFWMLGMDTEKPGDFLRAYLTGYRKLLKAAEGTGLKIYRGAEVRFDGCKNDYLVYGYSDALLQDPEAVFTMGAAAFYERVKADGAMLIHAHPYRDGGEPTSPLALDGVETRNTHPGHRNRNELAAAFAQKHGLLQTGGSDTHVMLHLGRGGILSPTLPENDDELVALLRSGRYSLIGAYD